MKERMTYSQITQIDAWETHEELVKERVRKTLARERMLARDFRRVKSFAETTTYQRWGTSQRLVTCAKAEASHVLFTRTERLA